MGSGEREGAAKIHSLAAMPRGNRLFSLGWLVLPRMVSRV